MLNEMFVKLSILMFVTLSILREPNMKMCTLVPYPGSLSFSRVMPKTMHLFVYVLNLKIDVVLKALHAVVIR